MPLDNTGIFKCFVAQLNGCKYLKKNMDDLLDLSEYYNTQGQDVQKLKQAWLSEQLAPELLPYQFLLVNDITEQLNEAERTIQALEDKHKVDDAFRVKILKMDHTRYHNGYFTSHFRVKYYLSRYLLSRLLKIQQFHTFLVQQETTDLLSPKEREYLEVGDLLFLSLTTVI